MKNFKKHALVGLFAASSAFAGLAHAQTASVEVKGTVDVKLTILESCEINGVEDALTPGSVADLGTLDFGAYAVGTDKTVEAGSDATTAGLNVTISCNETYPNFKVILTGSKNAHSGSERTLTHVGGAVKGITYRVFDDSGKTNVLDDNAVLVTGMTGTTASFDLFATADLEPDHIAGQYEDVLNFDIIF